MYPKISIKNYLKELKRAGVSVVKQGRKSKHMQIALSVMLKCSEERKDQYAFVKRGVYKGKRRRYMSMNLKNAWEWGKSAMPNCNISLKQFRNAAKKLTFITKFTPYKTRLHCESCFSFNSVLNAGKINKVDLFKKVEGLTSGFTFTQGHFTFTQGQLLKLPKIWAAHVARKKSRGFVWIDKNKDWLEFRDKMDQLRDYIEEKLAAEEINVATLQIAEKTKTAEDGTEKATKKITYIKKSTMPREQYINFVIRLIIGCSSTTQAGILKDLYNGHCVIHI